MQKYEFQFQLKITTSVFIFRMKKVSVMNKFGPIHITIRYFLATNFIASCHLYSS